MAQSIFFRQRGRETSAQQVAPGPWRLPVMAETDAELWVVADASQGIGLELTKQLLRKGRLVIAMAADCFSADALQQVASEYPDHLVLLDLDVQSEASITQLVHRVDFTLRKASGSRRAVDVVAYATKRQVPLRSPNEPSQFRLGELQRLLQDDVTIPFSLVSLFAPAMRSANNPRVVFFASEFEQDYCVMKSTAYLLVHELRRTCPAAVAAIDPAMETTEASVIPDRTDTVFQRTVASCLEMIELLQSDQSGRFYSVRGDEIAW